jgi:hypothetical protein
MHSGNDVYAEQRMWFPAEVYRMDLKTASTAQSVVVTANAED